jgi:hypothetical protein
LAERTDHRSLDRDPIAEAPASKHWILRSGENESPFTNELCPEKQVILKSGMVSKGKGNRGLG